MALGAKRAKVVTLQPGPEAATRQVVPPSPHHTPNNASKTHGGARPTPHAPQKPRPTGKSWRAAMWSKQCASGRAHRRRSGQCARQQARPRLLLLMRSFSLLAPVPWMSCLALLGRVGGDVLSPRRQSLRAATSLTEPRPTRGDCPPTPSVCRPSSFLAVSTRASRAEESPATMGLKQGASPGGRGSAALAKPGAAWTAVSCRRSRGTATMLPAARPCLPRL